MFIRKQASFISRYDRRKELRELEKAELCLTKVIDNFMEQLFEDYPFTYNDLYTFYLKNFQSLCEFAQHTYKIKYHEINKFYFENNFKPLEKLL